MPNFVFKVKSRRKDKKSKPKWRGRVPIGIDQNGKPKYKTKTFETKRAANAWVAEYQRKKRHNEVIEPASTPFGDYFDSYLQMKKVMNHLLDSTITSYEDIFDRHIRPDLGDVPLNLLTATIIQALYMKMRTREPKPLSSRTVRYAHSIVHSCLCHAVKNRDLGKNPATYDQLTLPKKTKKAASMYPLSKMEADAVLDQTRKISGGRYHELIRLSFHTGMRPEEIFGLTWGDLTLDGDQPEVRVCRALKWHGKVKDGTRGFSHEEKLKTDSSRRVIAITTDVAKTLSNHQKKQSELLFKIDQRKLRRSDFVFTTPLYSPIERHTFLSRTWKKAIRLAAEHLYKDDPETRNNMLKSRFYDTRHTMATLWLQSRESVKVVSERLGHANIATTLETYAHVLKGMQRESLERVSEAIGL